MGAGVFGIGLPADEVSISSSSGYMSTKDGWLLVEEKVITGAAVTSYDFIPVLDGNASKIFVITAQIICAGGAGNANFSLRCNGATALGTNQRCVIEGAAFVGTTEANTWVALGYTAHQTSMICHVFCANNFERKYQSEVNTDYGGKVDHCSYFGWLSTPNSTTNITSLGIITNIASGIDIGSVLQLWKRKV